MTTTRTEIIKAIQAAVGANPDGVWGNESEWDFDHFKADGGWCFEAIREGEDIIVPGCFGTCFGGGDDPEDSGDTASGVSTKRNPSLEACALPLRYIGAHGPTRRALAGTPLPHVPWLTKVEVTDGETTITVPVIDLGPARRTGNGLDLTIAAARRFEPNATATNFRRPLAYRILGGAAYL